ncbi:hypothetical protein BRADI_2g05163v3 [Brachypodium distachyon]|uniref:Uncharacterized protein n=1 Tax=Brachypodium distachyon TaxID=15368 RepID=A0A0Q3IRP2_BRADI|nr:hypothetical protein BRADI_2g05163v3 [Brachypodium distachyon]
MNRKSCSCYFRPVNFEPILLSLGLEDETSRLCPVCLCRFSLYYPYPQKKEIQACHSSQQARWTDHAFYQNTFHEIDIK